MTSMSYFVTLCSSELSA